jgi:hypothetical protein
MNAYCENTFFRRNAEFLKSSLAVRILPLTFKRLIKYRLIRIYEKQSIIPSILTSAFDGRKRSVLRSGRLAPGMQLI